MAAATTTAAARSPPPPLPQLGVWPSKLHFTCTKEEPGQLLRLRLTNRSQDRPIMYKVKTTAPKRYRVNPNAATIPKGETVDVKVLSHWRDCHFADALSPSLLKHLLQVQGDAADDSLADG